MARILIVDDEKSILETVSKALERKGHDTILADNAFLGLKLAKQHIPDLILSDVCMEGQDGLAFLESIRRNPNLGAIPFIIMTGRPETGGMLRGIESAADGYIPKPFSLETLLHAVTSRLSREAVLRRDAAEIKSQLYRVLQASPDLIGMADTETLTLFFLNSAGQRMLGTQDNFHRPITDYFSPAASEILREHALDVAHRNTQWRGETVMISLSGERLPVDLVLQSHCRDDGGIEYVSVIARDLSERFEGERALRASEFRFRCLVDALPDAVLMSAPSGAITFCNAQAAKLLIYSPRDLLRLSIGEVFYGSPRRNTGCDTMLFQTGKVGQDHNVFRSTGEKVPVSVFTERLDLDGETMDLFILHNLSDRKRMERERQEFEVQLRQAQKLESIGQLAAGIAHEINTPTQYIGDNTRFLKDSFEELHKVFQNVQKCTEPNRSALSADEALAGLRVAVSNIDLAYLLEEIPSAITQSLEGIERVSNIVRAMKDFSHPNSSEKSLIDINQAIENTLTVARNEWKYVATVETHLEPDLPPVPCLPGELNQVILNLLVNAAHAIGDVVSGSNDKGVIRISSILRRDIVEIRISDTGTGIPLAARSRIFEPFFTTKEVGKGTGQGLAISRSVIVDKHGGSISFETTEGKGTTFIIRLPHTTP